MATAAPIRRADALGRPIELMHYSGILVVTDPQAVDDCARRLEALAGVEVHYRYPESGRLIAVQETATAGEQEDGLRRIQALPRVAFAALVHHLVDEAP